MDPFHRVGNCVGAWARALFVPRRLLGAKRAAMHRMLVSLCVMAVVGVGVAGAFAFRPVPVHAFGPALDPTFGTGGTVVTSFGQSAYLNDVAVQTDGKIVVGGWVSNGTYTSWALARYNTDGTLDPTFGVSGVAIHDFGHDNRINGLALQGDGSIVVAGTGDGSTLWTVGRYLPTGALDPIFGTNGIAATPVPLNGGDLYLGDVKIQHDGKIVTVGYNGGHTLNGSDITLVRYDTTGHLDPGFGNGGIRQVRYDGSVNDNVRSLAIEQDGSLLVFGDYAYGGPNQPLLAHFDALGNLDTTFGTNGFVTEQLGYFAGGSQVTTQPDGKILVVGGFYFFGFPTPPLASYIMRYNSNGTRDTTFGAGGAVINPFNSGNDGLARVIAMPDGTILVGGSEQGTFLLSRLLPNGSLDSSFGSNGSLTTSFAGSSTIRGLAKDTFGRAVAVGGSCGTSVCNWALARYGLAGDTTPPVITPTVSGILGSNGWYRSIVTVTWSVTDPESGIVSSTGCAPTILTADTGGTTLTCSATNGAGLSASQSVTIKIDQTPPTLNVSGTPDRTASSICEPVPTRPTFTPVDRLSGLDGTQGDSWTTPTTASGVGIYTYVAHAQDLAGNSASETRTYTVTYGSAFGGFLQPINADGSSHFKLGSTIPVKFQLLCNGVPVTNAVATLAVKQTSGLSALSANEPISTAMMTAGDTFRYDPDSQAYIFNLSTKAGYTNPDGGPVTFAAGTWLLSVLLDDGTSRSVSMQLVS